VTYSFTNGTASDAGQVNTNFTDIISGTSDGTKDFSIAALTCAGTSTFNGNVLLGNASGDDVQFNGSLATSIPIKTQRTYDIGSADLGLRIIYLGMNSTFTIALAAPSSGASADYTLTLPPVVGGVGDMPYNTGSGTLLWKPSGIVVDAAAGTSGVTLSTTDQDVHVFAPSAAITVKLDNSFGAGRVLRFINNGSAIISLTAQDDSAIRQVYPSSVGNLVCISDAPADSGDWEGLDVIMSDTVAMTNPTMTGFGTPSNIEFLYQRHGSWMHLRGAFTSGTPTTTAAIIAIPFTIDFSKLYNAAGAQLNQVGSFYFTPTTSQLIWQTSRGGAVSVDSDDTDGLYLSRRVNSVSFEKDVADDMLVSGQYVFIDCWLPISGWTPKKG
jgi:hypothetical protein